MANDERADASAIVTPSPSPRAHKPSFVYLLQSFPGGYTYIGATVDLKTRLRRHNKELVGGSKRTGRHVDRGERWTLICFVKHFPAWRDTLQFEFMWQRIVRIRGKRTIEQRFGDLCTLLLRGRSTKPSTPFNQWQNAEDSPITVCLVEEAWRPHLTRVWSERSIPILLE